MGGGVWGGVYSAPLWYRALMLCPIKFLQYGVHICIFWCILTAIKCLHIYQLMSECVWGGILNNFS